METVLSQVKGYLNPESQFQGPQIGIAIIFQSELPQVKLTSTVQILFVPHYLFFLFPAMQEPSLRSVLNITSNVK